MPVTVVTAGSEEPVAAAQLSVDGSTATTGPDGTVTLTAMRGASVEVTAGGHDPGAAVVPDEGPLQVTLRSNLVTG